MKSLVGLLCFVVTAFADTRYEPTWDSLDKRPLPGWYDEAKFGIFIHWGVFSVPSFGSEWFWHSWKTGSKPEVDFMKKNYPPNWAYADFAKEFTTEFYDATQWAKILQASGAKYVVLTSKHHEGFCNWATNVSFNWNSKDVGPNRDLVGELAEAIHDHSDLHFGLYHSLFEWFNPLYLNDKANNFSSQDFVMRKTMPELYEIVSKYKPHVVWSDGSDGPSSYWNSTHFLAWLYNESPVKDVVVTNDRWGTDTGCKHGGYYTCHDRFNPGKLFPHKWENCMTIDRHSWGYRRNSQLSDYLTMNDLLKELVSTVSCGGNLLMNIGPTHDGRIMPIFEERLRSMGDWLKVNGEAIYGSKPWTNQNDTTTANVWYTSVKSSDQGLWVYAIILEWPTGQTLKLGAPKTTDTTTVNLLGYQQEVKWASAGASGGIIIEVPVIPPNKMPCDYAWVFKMAKLAN